MLGELKKLNYPGGKEELLYFLQSIVGSNTVTVDDIRVLCAHAPPGYHLRDKSLVSYCACFGWISKVEGITLCAEIRNILGDQVRLNSYLIESSLKVLFDNKVLTSDMFIYDIEKCRVLFRNELLPLSFAAIRNMLISQEFLIAERKEYKTEFCVHPNFENILARFCKKSADIMTLEQLKQRLEANSAAGAKAESFVLEHEKQRIHNPVLKSAIKQVSEVDVCAGYDILSFENDMSVCHDRFIEVKAVSKNLRFFWSKNELEAARLKGEKYFLYLVDITKITDENYCPEIISNPALSVMKSSNWLVEPESYQIQKI